MILGRHRHVASACFDELDDAVEALRPAGSPPIALNAHSFPGELPDDAIVYNLENVGLQVMPDAFPNHRIWDFSLANTRAWNGRAEHVPVGYHRSMERFTPRPLSEATCDVVLAGAMNERRTRLVRELEARGLVVAVLSHHAPLYGQVRDEVLARAKLALNVRYFEGGLFPALRAAHCVANRVPVLSESAVDMPVWNVLEAHYDDLVTAAVALISDPTKLEVAAAHAYNAFRDHPMKLP